jgi:uncharacterized repeat protein (TIGR03803 family)
MNKYSVIFYMFLLFLGQKIKAQNTQLWGMTCNGGNINGNSAGNGTIFKIDLDSSGFDTTHAFKGSDGSSATGTLLQAMDGTLYGMTSAGGKHDDGVIFSINPSNNQYNDIYDFEGYPTGGIPYGSLIQDSNGILYGMTHSGGGHSVGVIFSFDPANFKYKDLYDFNSDSGGYPYFGNLTIVGNKLYGLTSRGGIYGIGNGVLFSFDISDSSYNDLHNFGNYLDTNNNEANPYGSLLLASNGKLYGMCHLIELSGGTYSGGCIFSFDPDSETYKQVYIFSFSYDSLADPYGSLIQVGDSMLYGMTFSGGYTTGDSAYAGNIFSFDINNDSISYLYNFNRTGADEPYGSLLQASNNKLYGMTSQGNYGIGNIFSFDLGVNIYNDIHDFNYSTGSNPLGSLIEIISNPSGINQLSTINSGVSIFPNPASNRLSIRSGQLMDKIEIKNILGQTIIENSFDTGINQKTIDISRLSQGIYFITITSNVQTISLKFIVTM